MWDALTFGGQPHWQVCSCCGYLTSVATTGDGLGSWVSNFVGRAGCGLKWPTGQLLRAEGAAGGGSRVGRRWSCLGICGQVDLGLLLARCQGLVDRAREPSHPLLIMRRVGGRA